MRYPFWLGQRVKVVGERGLSKSFEGVVKAYRASFTVLVERNAGELVYCPTCICQPVEPLLDEPGGLPMLSYSIDAVATPAGVNFILKNERGTPLACGGRELIRCVELSAYYQDTLDQLMSRLEFRGLLQTRRQRSKVSA